MPEPLTFGSLFAGGGLMDLGLERAGLQCRWQVEIDDYARRVLAKHWPRVPRWRDIRTFLPDTASERRGSWGPGRTAARRQRRSDSTWVSRWRVDVIAAGFPCQDISYAGAGAGLDGKRSGLWWEAARVIRTLRPRYVLLENVAALLTRGLDAVLGTLDSLGYVGESHCLPAAYVGAPHIRDRVFILGYAAREPQSWSAQRVSSRCSVGEPGCESDDVADAGRLQSERRRVDGNVAGQAGASEAGGEERQRHGYAAEYRGEALADPDGPRERQPGGGVAEVGGRPGYGCTPGRLAEFRRRVGVHWAVDPADDPESGVGGVVDGSAQRMDGGLNEEELGSEKGGSKGVPYSSAMREMRLEGSRTEASPGHYEAPGDHIPLPGMPHGSRRSGGEMGEGPEAAEAVQGLWSGVHSASLQESQHLLPRVPERDRPNQRHEAMGFGYTPRMASGIPNRVDRLRILGNGVVPQVAQFWGERLIEFHQATEAADGP